jgi:signal peptidase I
VRRVWLVVLVVLLFIGLRLWLGSVVVVRGFTMAPAYLDGDVLLIQSEKEVQAGDVVVVAVDDEAVLRRVVALTGDKVGSESGALTRNGKSLVETSCQSVLIPTDESRKRARKCVVESSSDTHRYQVLTDYVAPDRPWSFRLSPTAVPAEQVFVLADDRRTAVSKDSSGLIAKSRILGVVNHRIWTRGTPPSVD